MTRVNLLPWREKIIHRRKKGWLITLLLVLMMAGAGSILVKEYLKLARTQTELWIAQQDSFLKQSAWVFDLQQQLIQQLSEAVRQDEKSRQQALTLDYWRCFWRQLPGWIPVPVWLVAVSLQQNILTLQGQSDTSDNLMLFSRRLRQQPFFTRIDIREMARIADGGYRFILKAQLSDRMLFTEGLNNE